MSHATHPRCGRLLRPVALAVSFALPIGSISVATIFTSVLVSTAQAQTPAKIVEGKVFDKGETPLSGAIVYLQDQKTNIIKTFITTPDGSYRFGQLSADSDFKLWARYKDLKSKTRLISSFDPKLTVTQDFHISE